MTTLVTFSPAGGAEHIGECIARGISEAGFDHIDLTPVAAADSTPRIVSGDVAVIAVPVYYGRVPDTAARRLRRLRGCATPAVLVVVYGNRAYEDALAELREIAVEIGFEPVAAAAFVAEHSFSSATVPLASGRPDVIDLERAVNFGKLVRDRLDRMAEVETKISLDIPGNRPYRAKPDRVPTTPRTDPEACDLCGECAESCPTGAISVTDEVNTDPDACILCCACIRACPNDGRIIDGQWYEGITAKLADFCVEPRKPEFFF